MSSQNVLFPSRFNESLSGFLGIASALQAFEADFPRSEMGRPSFRILRPVLQKHFRCFHGIADSPPHIAALAGKDRDWIGPSVFRHAQQRAAGRAVA